MNLDEDFKKIFTKKNVDIEFKNYKREYEEKFKALGLSDEYCNFEKIGKEIHRFFDLVYEGVPYGAYEFSKFQITPYMPDWGNFQYFRINDYCDTSIGILTIKDAVFLRLLYRSIEKYLDKKFHKLRDSVYSHRKDVHVHTAVKGIYSLLKSDDVDSILKCDIVNFYKNIDRSIALKKIIDFFGEENILIISYLKKYLCYLDHTEGIAIEPIMGPLIENIYMYDFDMFVKDILSHEFKICKYIRYIDDFVLLCSTENIENLKKRIETNLKQYNLKIHSDEPKTQIIELKKKSDSLTFLGFDISKNEISISSGIMTSIKEKIQSTVQNYGPVKHVKKRQDLERVTRNIQDIFLDGKEKPKKAKFCNICEGRVLEQNILDYFIITTNERQFEEFDQYIFSELVTRYSDSYSIDNLRKVLKRIRFISLKDTFIKVRDSKKDREKYCDCSYYLSGHQLLGENKKKEKIKGELFFINEIIEASEDDHGFVTLFKIGRGKYPKLEINELSENQQLAAMLGENLIQEGSYIRINNKEVERADEEEEVVTLKLQCQYLSNVLSKYIKTEVDTHMNTIKGNAKSAFSYHINVGHGNCSIVVLEHEDRKEIIMVDCSVFDTSQKKRFDKNIDFCIEHIKNKFNIDEFKIDNLLITHLHYDHINGINQYLFNKHMDYLKDASVWINNDYKWSVKESLTLMKNIEKYCEELSLKLREPILKNGTSGIEIIYPENTILSEAPTEPRVDKYDIVPKLKINNSSVIYKVSSSDKSIIFPGDIETDGWNKVRRCYPYLSDHDFYCISHHGSITGHTRTICGYKHGPNITKVSDGCCLKKINIIMAHDGAYKRPGKPKAIINQQVLHDFKDRVYRTDKFTSDERAKFIEINWQEERVYYNGVIPKVDPKLS